MTAIAEHTLPAPKALIHCDFVLDIGAGIRPMQWYVPKRHVCVDPHKPYVEVLKSAGYEAHVSDAIRALRRFRPEAIYLLDVVEHMDKDAGLKVIDIALKKASKQVVVYTPLGFVEQHEDHWNLGGEFWQTHRSGWLPVDFPGWLIQTFKREGFFAIHDQ